MPTIILKVKPSGHKNSYKTNLSLHGSARPDMIELVNDSLARLHSFDPQCHANKPPKFRKISTGHYEVTLAIPMEEAVISIAHTMEAVGYYFKFQYSGSADPHYPKAGEALSTTKRDLILFQTAEFQ